MVLVQGATDVLRCISVGDDTKWVIGAVVGVSMFLIMTNCSNAEPRLAREPVIKLEISILTSQYAEI